MERSMPRSMPRSRRGLVWLFALLFLAVVVCLAGCESQETASERVIYVPILAEASWLLDDVAFMRGVNLAVDELNAEYGQQGLVIKSALIDDQARYETGVEKATELAADPLVTAVLDLQDFDVTETTSHILSRSNIPVLFPYGAYDGLFTKENPYLFCGVPSFADLGQAMALYVKEHGFQRIAVYYNGVQSQNELVTAFELALLDTDARVVDYVSSIISSSHFNGIYARWAALGVDAVVIAQYGLDEALAVLEIIRARDKRLAIIGEPVFNMANGMVNHREA
ncbi:MAG: ABC transporter substrate-binding protein, partial [Limnochordia bacterium]|nr:ABC transporter substrate-binding protein [Limnochordia bacterium]